MSLNSRWQFGDILSLSRNDRISISSLYWIRGSKNCFLASFSNLHCYFLFRVFLRKRYLLVSLHPSWLRGNCISYSLFYTFGSPSTTCTSAPIFLAHMMCFLKARCSRESGTKICTVSRYAFCRRFLMQTSVGSSQIIPFLLTQISSNWHFLAWHKPLLSQRSTAQARNPQGISKSWIKVDCCLSDDSFWMPSQALFPLDCVPVGSLHFVQYVSADLPCYEILRSGFLNRPLPFGMRIKVSPEGRHTFNRM